MPFVIVFLVCLISSIGFALMYSAAQGNMHPWAIKQIMHFAMFMPLMILISVIDLRLWYKSAYLIYYLALLLLLLMHLLGYTAMGATRWINLGIIKLQPSELMKLAIILALARYFHDLHVREIKIVNLITPLIMTIIPAILIIREPDLGTGTILLMVGAMIFFAAGTKTWIFVAGIISCAAAMPLIWQFLYDYQKNRILIFLNPESDPLGSGYNIIQSKIAIGSGGLFGKGFIQGSQSQLQFLPEHQTDFIFTMLCEEWGLFGGVLVLLLFAILIFYCYIIAINSRSQFSRLLAIGVTSLIFLHVFINIAMVCC